VLFDEPTANLDGAAEQAVLDSVRELCRGRTVIAAGPAGRPGTRPDATAEEVRPVLRLARLADWVDAVIDLGLTHRAGSLTGQADEKT
jgi:hypothetical protein